VGWKYAVYLPDWEVWGMEEVLQEDSRESPEKVGEMEVR